jgi:hypothetical protein
MELFTYLAIALALLQVADVYTTNKALSVPGTIVGNIFIQKVMEVFGKYWSLPKLAIAWGAIWGATTIPELGDYRDGLMIVMILIYIMAVRSNWKLYQLNK